MLTAFGTLPTHEAQSITLNFIKRLPKMNEIYHIYVISIITTCSLPISFFGFHEPSSFHSYQQIACTDNIFVFCCCSNNS